MQQEWIGKMQERGVCSCDQEHMFNCPEPAARTDDELQGVLDQLLERGDNPYLSEESKREYLVAKKRPAERRKRASAGTARTSE